MTKFLSLLRADTYDLHKGLLRSNASTCQFYFFGFIL